MCCDCICSSSRLTRSILRRRHHHLQPRPRPVPPPRAATTFSCMATSRDQRLTVCSTCVDVDIDVQLCMYTCCCVHTYTNICISPAAKLAGKSDGTFFFRSREAGNTDSYILAVVYRGKPTHHIVDRTRSAMVLRYIYTGTCVSHPLFYRYLHTCAVRMPSSSSTSARRRTPRASQRLVSMDQLHPIAITDQSQPCVLTHTHTHTLFYMVPVTGC